MVKLTAGTTILEFKNAECKRWKLLYSDATSAECEICYSYTRLITLKLYELLSDMALIKDGSLPDHICI
jgi:hypothetical protein